MDGAKIPSQSVDNTPGQSSCSKSLTVALPFCLLGSGIAEEDDWKWAVCVAVLQLEIIASSACQLLFILPAPSVLFVFPQNNPWCTHNLGWDTVSPIQIKIPVQAEADIY